MLFGDLSNDTPLVWPHQQTKVKPIIKIGTLFRANLAILKVPSVKDSTILPLIVATRHLIKFLFIDASSTRIPLLSDLL